jgi:hypothetical protein
MNDLGLKDPSGYVYLVEQSGVAAGDGLAGWTYSFTYGYQGLDAARGVKGEVAFESGAEDGSGSMTRTFAIGEKAVSLGETPEALEITVLSADAAAGDVRIDVLYADYEAVVANGAGGCSVFSFRRIGTDGDFLPYDGSATRRLTFSGLNALVPQSAPVSMKVVVPPPMPGPASFRDPFAPFVERMEPIVLGEGTMANAEALGGVLETNLSELFAGALVPLTVGVAAVYASTVGAGGVAVRVPVALVPAAAVLPPGVEDAGVMPVSSFAAALGETLAAWYRTVAPAPGGAFEFDVSVSARAESVPLLRLALIVVPLRGA